MNILPINGVFIVDLRTSSFDKKKNNENQKVISKDPLELSIRPITNYKTNNIKDEFNSLSQDVLVKKMQICQNGSSCMFWAISQVKGAFFFFVILIGLKTRHVKLFIYI